MQNTASAQPQEPSETSIANSPAIRCVDLVKTYDGTVEAVRGLNLEVRRGECFGLLGPNGAGKTTTIEILEGLLQPTSGEVEVLGQSWGSSRDNELKQKIGISLQETRLSEKLHVDETIKLFRSFYNSGIDPAEAMELVSLTSKRSSQVGKLSGGQKQRLALACALVGAPELLFLDEPTNGLDPTSRRQVWEILRSVREQGATVLITTHYMDEAERLCDRVGIVDHGKIIALDTPSELIHSLGGDHVIEFSACQKGSSEQDETDDSSPTAIEGLEDKLTNLPSVKAVRTTPAGFSLGIGSPAKAVPGLMDLIETENLELLSLTTRHASLEDVFVSLTGRNLQEEDEEA